MNALLLAAGFGTRLGAFGESTPKGLIQHGQSTLIGKVVSDVLRMKGMVASRAIVTNERFKEKYARWLVDKGYGEDFSFISDGATHPDNRKGAIGDIFFSLDQLSWWKDDLLVLSTDTYYEFSMTGFVEFATKRKNFVTVVRNMGSTDEIKGRLGCAVIQEEKIVEFVEKPENPPSTLAAIPFYYYSKEVLKQLPEYKESGGNMDAPGSMIPWLLTKGVPVFAYLTEGKTLDVGTSSDVKKLQFFSS